MKRRLSGTLKIVLWALAAAATFVICALIVLAAAACTKGTSETPDRGPIGTAWEAGWEVTSFAADYVIDSQGSLHATEQIAVDFHDVPKHGIYRNFFWRVDCPPPRIQTEALVSACNSRAGAVLCDRLLFRPRTPAGSPSRRGACAHSARAHDVETDGDRQ